MKQLEEKTTNIGMFQHKSFLLIKKKQKTLKLISNMDRSPLRYLLFSHTILLTTGRLLTWDRTWNLLARSRTLNTRLSCP